MSLKFVDEETREKFRLKPGGLRRHEGTGVGDGDELVERGRVHGEGQYRVLAASALEFAEASDTADEVNPFVRPRVLDTEDGGNQVVLKNRDIE